MIGTQDGTVLASQGSGESAKEGSEGSGLSDILMRKWGFALAPVTEEDAAELGLDKARGLRVTEVRPDGPAANRGIVPGCIVLGINRQDVGSLAAVKKLIGEQNVDGILLRVRYPQGVTAFVVLRAEK
jgi:serine protease Do